MSRLAYALAALLIIGGGAYALWPAPQVQTTPLLTAPAPAAWTTTVDQLNAHITPSAVTVTVSGKDTTYAVNPEKIRTLWSTLARIVVPTAKVIPKIDEAQLAGYGVTARRQAAADDGTQLVRWGGNGGQAYVWNGSTRMLLAVEPSVLADLDRAAQPPVPEKILDIPRDLARVTIDGLTLILQDGEWLAEKFPNRPQFGPRLGALLAALGRVECKDLVGVPVLGLPVVGTVEFSSPAGMPRMAGLMPHAAGQAVSVYDASGVALVAISGFPAQRTDAALLNELRAAFATFKRDVMVDVLSEMPRQDVLQVDFTQSGTSEWSLRRVAKPLAISGFSWDVVWAGGRENASDQVVDELAARLQAAAIRDPLRDSSALKAVPPGAITITFVSTAPNVKPVAVAVGAGEMRTATHRARLADDGELERSLTPAALLDTRLTRRDPTRVAKIQRRFLAESEPRDEVVTRSENGSWIQTYPKPGISGPPPVDGAAVDRLVRNLVAARMQNVRLIANEKRSDEFRQLLEKPEFEIDIRFAAMAGGQATNDETDLDLSAAQNWGLAMRKNGERWQVVDKDLTLSFALDADTVEEFRRPFTAGQIFPVVASAVTSATISRESGTPVVTLTARANEWLVAEGDQPAVAADAVRVRRWFRDLASLQVPAGMSLDARAPVPAPLETVATITCTVPAVGGDVQNPTEMLSLAVLRPGPQGQAVQVWSNRGTSRFPRGRIVLPPAISAEFMLSAGDFRK